MPWNGIGTFTRVYSWVQDATNGIDINAMRMDTDTNDIASGLGNVLTRDGQGFATANLPMGGFKHTGAADGSSVSDYATYGQLTTGSATLSNKTLVAPIITSTATLTGTLNKLTLTAAATAATLTLADNSSLITVGAYAVTLTATAATGVTLPIAGTLATLAGSETLTNKTITSFTGSGGLLTMPAGPDTLVGRATTDTLTNKTYTDGMFSGTPTITTAQNWRTALGIKATFTSTDLTITTAGSTGNIAHGLGAIPLCFFFLVCQTNEGGYTAGQLVPIAAASIGGNTGDAALGFGIAVDTTNISVRYATDSTVFVIVNKSNGTVQALTNTNWKLRIIAISV